MVGPKANVGTEEDSTLLFRYRFCALAVTTLDLFEKLKMRKGKSHGKICSKS